jgi:hypothetical protein
MGNAVAPVNRNVMRVVPLATILIFVCSFVWLVGYNGKVLLFDVGVPGSTKNEFWLWVDSGFGEWVLTWVAMGFFSFRCSVSMVWSMMTWPILFDRIESTAIVGKRCTVSYVPTGLETTAIRYGSSLVTISPIAVRVKIRDEYKVVVVDANTG